MNINSKSLELAMANAIITRAELSKISGVAPDTLYKILRQKRDARPSTVGKIAKALGVTVDDLIEKEV